MSCFRLMNNNYLDSDFLAATDVSSEHASFPLSNTFNKQTRSKVWRTTGYFLIESGDNTIVFNEGGGDFTATVAAGEYTAATLCTAIDTALSAAGAGSYTVTYTAAFKFQIVKSTGTFNIKWTHANSADMAGILGFSTASDDTGALTYLADNVRIHTSEWAIFDFGVSVSPSSFILIGERNEAIKISDSATIILYGNDTNVWTSPSYSQVLTFDEEAIAEFSDTTLHGSALRYWKLEIIDKTNPLGYVEINGLYIGDHFSGAAGSVQFPMSVNLIDNSKNIISEGGQSLADIYEQTAEYSVTWNFLSKEDIEDITEFFELVGTAIPFYVSMDTDEAFSTSFNRRVKYVKFTGVDYSLDGANRFSCDMNMREDL